MKNTAIRELVSNTMISLQECGLAPHTAWDIYSHVFLQIIKLHEMEEKEAFDRSIVTKYVHDIEERYDRNEISYRSYRKFKYNIGRLTEMHDTGKLEWSAPVKISSFVLNEYYEKILAEFVSQENVSPKAKSDITWVGRKYFSWLIQEGHHNLATAGTNEVQRFMIYCSKHMVSGSVHNVKLYMKKLCCYLLQKGYTTESYDALLSFPVSRESKLSSAVSREDIAMTLEMIDRRTPQGKRDYAMILLGVVTGLRAIDIAKISRKDIDWKRGEIKIIQSKTGNSLALPLTKDVGEAISEYILKVRPDAAYENIFLRIRPPFRPFSNGVAIGDIYDYYRKRAGLPRDAHDGMGFHSLRRSLGKNLITTGAPVTMVAQILGDNDIDSTKKYISLDGCHLKECALNFDGIKPKRGVLSL